jgi:hypothetical protein
MQRIHRKHPQRNQMNLNTADNTRKTRTTKPDESQHCWQHEENTNNETRWISTMLTTRGKHEQRNQMNLNNADNTRKTRTIKPWIVSHIKGFYKRTSLHTPHNIRILLEENPCNILWPFNILRKDVKTHFIVCTVSTALQLTYSHWIQLPTEWYSSVKFNQVVTICTTYFNTLKLCILPTHRICVFRMILTTKSDYFPKQH